MDILKVDVEGAEWGALEVAVDQRLFARGLIRQLLIEYHLPPHRTQPHTNARYERVLCGLREQGMVAWHEHRPATDSMEYMYMWSGKAHNLEAHT